MSTKIINLTKLTNTYILPTLLMIWLNSAYGWDCDCGEKDNDQDQCRNCSNTHSQQESQRPPPTPPFEHFRQQGAEILQAAATGIQSLGIQEGGLLSGRLSGVPVGKEPVDELFHGMMKLTLETLLKEGNLKPAENQYLTARATQVMDQLDENGWLLGHAPSMASATGQIGQLARQEGSTIRNWSESLQQAFTVFREQAAAAVQICTPSFTGLYSCSGGHRITATQAARAIMLALAFLSHQGIRDEELQPLIVQALVFVTGYGMTNINERFQAQLTSIHRLQLSQLASDWSERIAEIIYSVTQNHVIEVEIHPDVFIAITWSQQHPFQFTWAAGPFLETNVDVERLCEVIKHIHRNSGNVLNLL